MIPVLSETGGCPYSPGAARSSRPSGTDCARGSCGAPARCACSSPSRPSPSARTAGTGRSTGPSSSGAGRRLYSWTRVHAAPSAFAADVPYTVGVVDLADGVRIATQILADAPAADRPVELIALAYGNLTLFAVRPVG
ncbi:Zn-ribbon domain-containing OB-fold protein [Pseudonocardia terrae]|uniref:Zn-ribbon domain-containing OB-fold protein n=1 Tax=Pseudonocardia terrae TaxID=2905831 RepID=UPI002107F320|nr:OB-fold domain-containing protein [Pseudonocardia terrae]